STPEAGAGTSIVTLSVSSSTSGSSAATASPACLNHLPTVASVTDSPSAGTRISIAMRYRLLGQRRSLIQSLFGQRLQFRLVFAGDCGRGRGRGGAPGIARSLVLRLDVIEHPGEVRLDEAPRSHVLGLLLAPHHLRLGKAGELLDQRPRREGIKLLDAEQVDVVKSALLALIIKIVIDLARAQHYALDLGIGLEIDRLSFKKLRIVPQ